MFTRILVPLEHSAYDAHILDYVRRLASWSKAAIVLVHVADGWAARNAQQLQLRESEEMAADRRYLEDACAALRADGFTADAVLAAGDPANEICAAAERERCDLIAMATHGHKGLQDLIYGATANTVRHKTLIPVLMVRQPPANA
jgi:nucleotide-binding universal stress UspA family protein